MADLRDQILEYADRLYTKALKEMDAERFRRSDIYALSAYSASAFLAGDQGASQEMRDRAVQLEQAAWTLSKQAISAQRLAMVRPRMQGADDIEDMRDTVRKIAMISTSKD